MATEHDPSLDLLKGIDPRIFEAVTQEQVASQEFSRDVTHINAPLALKLLANARKHRETAVAPDQAYMDGARDILGLIARLQPSTTFDELEAAMLDVPA